MVLDNSEFTMHVGNSDYFTMRAVTELSRKGGGAHGDPSLLNVFDAWQFEPGAPFPTSSVPYHISAHGVLLVTDPATHRKYLVLTLPSRHRTPLIPGWNVTFAEQMWAPGPETPQEPWWSPYIKGLRIEAPNDRTGDRDIWSTVRRGLFEELGVGDHELTTCKLVASCIEQDMHSVAFIFVLQTTITLQELHKCKLTAPDREIGALAAFPLDGPSANGGSLDPGRQFAALLSMQHFDGGPYLLPRSERSAVEPWHLSSRLRIHAAARHVLGARLLDYIDFA